MITISIKIDIKDKIPTKTIILSSKLNGENMRRKLKLDELEEKEDSIEIIISKPIASFNTSYFLGLFTTSINKNKTKETFLKKYNFICDEYIMKDIYDGIDEALKHIKLLQVE